METIDYNGFSIKIEYDDMAESPRDWDNLGTMVCNHRRYDLGDVQLKDESFLSYINREFSIVEGCRWTGFSEKEEAKIQKWVDKNLLLLPLYLYDHSGITMRTGPFSCPWDSGQVGIIYITKDKIRKEYGWKVINKARREKIYSYLEGEVETYDNYLTGSVYYYSIEDSEGETIDSCSGFYGYDHEESELLRTAKNAIDCEIKSRMEDHITAALAEVKKEHNHFAYGVGI